MFNKFEVKKQGIALAVFMTLGTSMVSQAASTPVAAGKGKLSISGELVSSTCVIDTSKTNEPLEIKLPKVGTNTLVAAGDIAGTMPIIIHVKDCPVTAGAQGAPNTPVFDSIAAFFEARTDNDWDSSTGNLINTFTPAQSTTDVPATNVQLRIFNWGGGQAISLGNSGNSFKVQNDGTAELKYTTGYYATGKTTAGKVAATANYTLVYP